MAVAVVMVAVAVAIAMVVVVVVVMAMMMMIMAVVVVMVKASSFKVPVDMFMMETSSILWHADDPPKLGYILYDVTEGVTLVLDCHDEPMR